MSLPTLDEVDRFPVPEMLVPRIAQEHDYTIEYAAGTLREAKRMLYLKVLSKKDISPSVLVDMAWHEMLMFTKFYKHFCDFLGEYIHHDPTPGPPDGGHLYADTKERYEKHFGTKPDSQFWP